MAKILVSDECEKLGSVLRVMSIILAQLMQRSPERTLLHLATPLLHPLLALTGNTAYRDLHRQVLSHCPVITYFVSLLCFHSYSVPCSFLGGALPWYWRGYVLVRLIREFTHCRGGRMIFHYSIVQVHFVFC